MARANKRILEESDPKPTSSSSDWLRIVQFFYVEFFWALIPGTIALSLTFAILVLPT